MTEWRRGLLGGCRLSRKLGSSGISDTTELVCRVRDFEREVSQDAPDCFGPIKAREAAVACIQDYSIEFGEGGNKLLGEGSDGEEGSEVELLGLERDAIVQGCFALLRVDIEVLLQSVKGIIALLLISGSVY